jgi:4-oxalocrotonate tautomerase
MPLINVRLVEGVFTPKEKQEIQEKLTETMVAIEGEELRPYTVVIVDEVPSGQWAYGGKTVTTEMVKAIRAGKKAEAA